MPVCSNAIFRDVIEGQENGNMNHCYIISHAKSTRARCPTIATPYTYIQVTEQLLCEYFCDFLLVCVCVRCAPFLYSVAQCFAIKIQLYDKCCAA